jgi:hypothetical protein
MSLTLSDADLARLQDCPGGIYAIWTDPDDLDGFDRVYIGKSKGVKRRIASHLRELRKGRHSVKLQDAWDTRGEAVFKCWLIEPLTANNADQLDGLLIEREKYWLRLHWAWNETHGYNFSYSSHSSKPQRKNFAEDVWLRRCVV